MTVKKVLSALLIISMLFMLAGCREKRSNIIPVTHGISFIADITYYNECYECLVTISKNWDMKIEMTYPDTIKGMSFNFDKNGELTLKYNNLEYKCETESMPEGIVCTYLYDIFKDTGKDDTTVIDDENNYYIQGKTAKSDYKMYVGATGLPIKIEEDKSGLSINIKNAALLKIN